MQGGERAVKNWRASPVLGVPNVREAAEYFRSI